MTVFSQNDILPVSNKTLKGVKKGSKMESNLIHSKIEIKREKNVEWLASEMTVAGQPISASTIYKKLKRRGCI